MDYVHVLLVHFFSFFLCLHAVETFFRIIFLCLQVVSCPVSFYIHAGFDSFSSCLHVGLVRIPVSSPSFEVRMDTSGSYALVKARTIFPDLHTHTTQVTRTLYTSRTRLTSTVYVPTLCAQFTRHVQDLQAYFTRVQFTPPPTRTISASELREQSMRQTKT